MFHDKASAPVSATDEYVQQQFLLPFDGGKGNDLAQLNGHHEQETTWNRVDLTLVLNGTYEAPQPSIGCRDDGRGLFYPGRQHAVAAETEAGKTWLALLASMTEISKGDNVLYLDFEDSEGGIVTRLMGMGADTALIGRHFIYVRPDEPATPASLTALLGYKPSLAIIDGVTEAMTMHGMDPLSNKDAADFGRMLPRKIARAGAAVVMMDHVVKNREARAGGYAIGAVHKLNGLNGAMFIIENVDPFGIGLTGRSRVYVRKDRPGQLRRHGVPSKGSLFHYCDLLVKSSGEQSASCSLPVPEVAGNNGDSKTLHVTMTKVSALLAGTTGNNAGTARGLSGNAVREELGGRNTTVQAALKMLVSEGYAQVEKVGSANEYTHVKLFRP